MRSTKQANAIFGTLAILCHLGGALFLIVGADAMPGNLPVAWSSFADPSVLLFLAGCIGLAEGTFFLNHIR